MRAVPCACAFQTKSVLTLSSCAPPTISGTLTVGGTTITATGEDVFILLLDKSGQPVWIKALDGNPANGQAAAVGPTGDAWITGWFGGSMTVLTSSGSTTLTAGDNDAFLLRLQGVVSEAKQGLNPGARS